MDGSAKWKTEQKRRPPVAGAPRRIALSDSPLRNFRTFRAKGDTRVKSPDTVSRFGAGAAGGRLLNPAGDVLRSARNFGADSLGNAGGDAPRGAPRYSALSASRRDTENRREGATPRGPAGKNCEKRRAQEIVSASQLWTRSSENSPVAPESREAPRCGRFSGGSSPDTRNSDVSHFPLFPRGYRGPGAPSRPGLANRKTSECGYPEK